MNVVMPSGPQLLHLLLASEASEHSVRQTCDRCLDSYICVPFTVMTQTIVSILFILSNLLRFRESEKMSAGINV